MPKGHLLCARNGKYYKWYHSDGHRHTYISKKNRHLAEQLALKKYLSLRLKDYIKEKRAIDYYLSHHFLSNEKTTKSLKNNTEYSENSNAEHLSVNKSIQPQMKQADQFLINNPEYQELLSSYFKPKSIELFDWANFPYDKNPKYPEQLIHKTISGHMVRSKSEALIAMMLHINKIPFRYECALQLNTSTIYPDFTIRHPHTKELYYWEHFGRMDDLFYSKNACSKLHLYASEGIIPSIQLITTYETQDHPLTSDLIEKIIKNYFL